MSRSAGLVRDGMFGQPTYVWRLEGLLSTGAVAGALQGRPLTAPLAL